MKIRLNFNRNDSVLPLPLGEGWGEGLRSRMRSLAPHQDCFAIRPLPNGERCIEASDKAEGGATTSLRDNIAIGAFQTESGARPIAINVV